MDGETESDKEMCKGKNQREKKLITKRRVDKAREKGKKPGKRNIKREGNEKEMGIGQRKGKGNMLENMNKGG